MSQINVEPGTVALRGVASILNVGDGDTTLSFDPRDPAECERAAKIVTEMLRLGFAIMVEDPPGSRTYRRVKAFDADKFQYIIGEVSAGDAQPERGTDEPAQDSPPAATGHAAPEPPAEASAGAGRPKARSGRAPAKTKRLAAATTRTVSIGRTAGG